MASRRDGDTALHEPAALIGDPTRAAMLLALLDRRALPMSMLAAEAGVSPPTASEHLAKLVSGGLLRTRREGRHRYYELASPQVGHALEALAQLAPTTPVRSLRSGTRLRALRVARTCYDHLAGHLGVAVMASLLDRHALVAEPHAAADDQPRDRLAAPGREVTYRVTDHGWELFAAIGVTRPETRRPLVRYCVDWTEQRHHLAGALGAALLTRLRELDWVRPGPRARSVAVPPAGRDGLAGWLGLDMDAVLNPGPS